MTDLRTRFGTADHLDVDDVWADIRARVDDDAPAPVRQLPTHRPRRWQRIAIVAAALAIGAASLTFLLPLRHDATAPGDANTLWTPGELRGWIAYSSDGEIRVVDPAAGGVAPDARLLFSPGSGAAWPLSWSPDGSSLLFLWSTPGDATNPSDRADLYLLHADGVVQRLTTEGDIEVGSFAADGTILASSATLGRGIVRVDPASGTRETIVPGGPAQDAWPAASPDGTIAFLRIGPDGSTSIMTTDAHGGQERTLVAGLPASKDSSGLAWSPDGSQIVFGLLSLANVPMVYVVRSDGSGLHSVIDGSFASWSPDGARLALDKQGSLITIAPDGTDPQGVGVTPHGNGIAARVGPWNASTD